MAATLDDYEVIATIGTGSYGTCKKIRRKKDGKIMVWKEMEYGSMSENEKQMLVSEVNLLRELRHQHIVRYHDRIIDRNKTIIYIIMEYCQGGDLASIIARHRKDGTHVPEDFAWKILIQTTLALKECHRRKNGKAVLHRDLKPANVFLDMDSNVKLGDFGLARVLHHETSFAQTYVGTPYYMSPELVNNMSYNEKSDIWALGCMLYELCALTPPFTASNQSELNRKIRIGDFPRLPPQYSMELDMMIRKLIQVEVAKRPSIGSVLADALIQSKMKILNQKNFNKAVAAIPEKSLMSGSGDATRIKKEDLLAKMRLLELKEKELESRERSLALREKAAEEKLRRARELMEEYRHRSDSAACGPTPRTPSLSPCPELTGTQTMFSSGHSTPDAAKKHVTFHDCLNGKENLRQKTSYSALMLNTFTGLYGDKDSYSTDLTKWDGTKDNSYRVKDRAVDYRVKDRAVDYRKDDRSSKIISRNLLHFR
ncbi:unnamed protein product [Lymnaea stagnalis]|uniref:non-specific serine/threonine protein kinase n=1 Tax=Lymnaea stagnalis TaxID=6523 RepID=A0AAV2H344_LYMST